MTTLERYLAIKHARGGAVAADGATVAVVTDLTGVPQAWSVPIGSGWPTELTIGDDRVQEVLTPPGDPEVVVFARDHGGDERTQLHRVRRDGLHEAPLAVDPEVVHRPGAFSPDGRTLYYTANARNGVDFDLHRVAVAAAAPEPERVAALEGWNAVTAVTADGGAVLVSHLRGLLDAEARLVDLADGRARTVGGVTGDRPVATFPGGFDPDGRLWLRSDRAADVAQAGVLAADGGWRPVTTHRWDCEALAVADGGGACAVNDDGVSRLFTLDLAGAAVARPVPLPTGVVEDLRVAPGGQRCSFTLSGPDRPPDVWVADLDTAEAAQVTRSSTGGLDPAGFVAPTLDRVEGHDGLPVPVWTYRPPDATAPPVVVWAHGGPESQARPAFDARFQHWVACGWAVVVPNVRGSTGYGRRYASLDDRRRRLDAVADLVRVGRWAQARPDLGERIAVAGASYGGYLTLSALVAAPDLWSAGVSLVGIANLVTFLERTADYRRSLREREYGSLRDDRDFLVEASPLTHVDRIRAPLLLVHGANDPRVPVGEAAQIHAALTDRGRTCDLLVFDDEGHGITTLANRRRAYRRVHEFLAAHLER